MIEFNPMKESNLILASTSPRRREMLSWMLPDFLTASPAIDESPLADEAPVMYVKRMAFEKGLNILKNGHESMIVLASDTIVVWDGKIFGKPADEAEARSMLTLLRGNQHQVYTAFTLLRKTPALEISECCVATVPMRAYTDAEMEAYIQSGDPLDKAGAYAIQHPDFQPVVQFSGCYACVMGLPLCHVVRHLSAWGIQLQSEPDAICLERLGYPCKISSSVLSFTDQITC